MNGFPTLVPVFIWARNYEWLPYLRVSYMVADDEKCALVEGSHL